MERRPDDLDQTRATIAAHELVATASAYLTADVAMQLPFEALGPFKNLLKVYFSSEPWNDAHDQQLADLVSPHVEAGWWEHDLGGGITLAHGIRDGRYVLWVGGAGEVAPSIFDRAFAGPVVPEATPHPRKVKFTTGGDPAPGTWYRRSDPDPPDDERVKRLFAEPDITDVMVAGDFVTVGLAGTSSWERRLEPILALVTELFWDPTRRRHEETRTRDDLIQEGLSLDVPPRPEDLHLLDPDEEAGRQMLLTAQHSDDPRVRRVAVAVLAESSDPEVRHRAVATGYADASRTVRRTAIDAAAGTEDQALRGFFEQALSDGDPWIRWKAVRALSEIGIEPSRSTVAELEEDPDFQVRFEVARVLRDPGTPASG